MATESKSVRPLVKKLIAELTAAGAAEFVDWVNYWRAGGEQWIESLDRLYPEQVATLSVFVTNQWAAHCKKRANQKARIRQLVSAICEQLLRDRLTAIALGR